MNKTKIIATLGPKSSKPNAISSLILNGVNVFRINISHVNDYSDLNKTVQLIRQTSDDLNYQVGILMDIAGPKIRVKVNTDPIKVKKGDLFTIGFGKPDIKINLNLSFNNFKFGVDFDVNFHHKLYV